MTPDARVQTAIECLDLIVAGEAAEQVLTRWARKARHAGSKDRAAIRDLVFDVLRRWWSSAARGGGESGRARMIGYLAEEGADLAAAFSGAGYGPAALGPDEGPAAAPDGIAAVDCPPAFHAELERSLGEAFAPVMRAMRDRAPVFLRVNTRAATLDEARASLAADGIVTRPAALAATALEVTERPRAVAQSRAFREGWVELQDAASQAVVEMLPLSQTDRVLDYCAGGGGKTLAMAARHRAVYHAHDAERRRLEALVPRAERAGAAIELRAGADLVREAPYDLVLVDAPCSGSGAWRRSPEGKIRMTPERLEALLQMQREILDTAAAHVGPRGALCYVTCSLMQVENDAQVARFVDAHSQFAVETTRHWTPLDGGDGFYAAILRRREKA